MKGLFYRNHCQGATTYPCDTNISDDFKVLLGKLMC